MLQPIGGKTAIPARLAPGVGPPGRSIEFTDGETDHTFQLFNCLPMKYEGCSIEQFKVRLDPPPTIGFYRVSFSGSHDLTATGMAIFGVSDAGGVTQEVEACTHDASARLMRHRKQPLAVLWRRSF